MDIAKIIKDGHLYWVEYIKTTVKEILEQQKAMALKSIEKTVDRTRNVIKTTTSSFKIYLNMLERYPLEFDNFDNPILPQVIAKNKKIL